MIYFAVEKKQMAIYEYKTNIRYTEINQENKLSDKGLINILNEAARKTFRNSRIWPK